MLLKTSDYSKNTPHPGSVELHEVLTRFVEPPFLFNEQGWEKWGLMGLLADFAVYYTQGDIVEIGIGESSFYFTHIAKKYGRKVYHCDIQVSDYENLSTVPDFFSDDNLMHCGPSDEFFANVELPKIALGFIDGDHLHQQVEKDFNNLFPLVTDNGYIFFHDLHPMDEEGTQENVCGDGYIFRQKLEQRGDVDVFTFPTSAWEAGLTIVRKIPHNAPYFQRNGRDDI